MQARAPLARSLTAGSFALAAGSLALLTAEAVLARSRHYLSPETAPLIEGEFGDQTSPAIRLAVLGDSTAAGVGVERTEDTVAAQVAAALAIDRRVTLTCVAIAGSRTGDLGPQVSRALLGRPDVALILIGANDATHATPLRRVSAQQATAVERLRAEGIAVVVGTCPDMGARNFLPPLRQVVAWQGRRVAQAQDIAVREAGGDPVPLDLICGPLFRADPATLSEDAFHPSAYGYRLWCEALVPTLSRVLEMRPIP